MHPKTKEKLKGCLVVLALLGALAWWKQGMIRYHLGMSGADAGVSKAVASMGEARANGDFEKLFGLMASEYQQGRLNEIDRMKKILVDGTDAQKAEVREQLARMGITEEQLKSQLPQAVAARMLASEVSADPGKFPTDNLEVVEIRIDRQRASVTVRQPDGRSGTMEFVKEGVTWKHRP